MASPRAHPTVGLAASAASWKKARDRIGSEKRSSPRAPSRVVHLMPQLIAIIVFPTPAPSAEASPAPSLASLYRESSFAPVRDSRIANARRSLTPKVVRKAAFKYNGVANFCGFLAALPADVGVLDPKLERTRALVKGGRVIPKNVAWLRKHRQAPRT